MKTEQAKMAEEGAQEVPEPCVGAQAAEEAGQQPERGVMYTEEEAALAAAVEGCGVAGDGKDSRRRARLETSKSEAIAHILLQGKKHWKSLPERAHKNFSMAKKPPEKHKHSLAVQSLATRVGMLAQSGLMKET